MSSNTEWSRAIAATIVKHLRDVEQAVLRNRKLSAMMENKGRLSFNQGGRGFDWRVKYQLHDVQGNTGQTPRTFQPINRYKTAELQYRGYQVTDIIYKKEMLENRGPEAIVNLAGDMVGDLTESFDETLGGEYYIDGEASGNTERWHGIETFMAATQTITITTGAARAANAADRFGYPDDAYAGLDTDLGAEGGAQLSGVWPNGTADAEFDYWTPIINNYTSSAYTGTTWAVNAIEAMRDTIIQCQRNGGMANQPDMILLDRELYRQALDLLDAKERIAVTAQNGLKSFGFNDIFEIDGVEVSWEYGIPAAVGYLFNCDCIELLSMQAGLLSEDVEVDIDSQGTKYVVDSLSNLKFKSPRNFGKFMTLA